MSSTEPLARRSVADHAATYIRRLIYEQRLRAGDRVPQDDVAQALGISRIPVREALITLESEGWLTIEIHRGAFVNAFDADAVRDHYTMFGLVYGFATRRAIARGGDGDELDARLASMLDELGFEDDPVVAERVALAFHGAIVEAARSPRVHTLLDAMSGLIPGNFFAEVPGSIAVERDGLAAILAAVRRRNEEAATRGYEEMMASHGELVVELLDGRGFFHP